MDRNSRMLDRTISRVVALRKESVDRNIYVVGGRATGKTSLSARRAWIEIRGNTHKVAMIRESLSARRAWIEI